MPSPIGDNGNTDLLVWGLDNIEDGTIEQAKKTKTLPFVEGHVALMPDAHIGLGSTVGSVIPTRGAIIPSAIGVDIGCGMAAIRTNMHANHLPNLDKLMSDIEQAVPAGVGKGREYDDAVHISNEIGLWSGHERTDRLVKKAISQCGSLGSGNHFFEICLDETDFVWIVLHSGSRGIGNELAKIHIDGAKNMMKKYFIELDNPDLAYLVEGTPEFEAYIADMLWAQKYALLNRETMLDRGFYAFRNYVGRMGKGTVFIEETINCHHNFTQMENHMGKNMWITRKGAIKAASGDMGIIPGSMGTRSYIVKGLGNPASYHSCSHGAGRVMSRKKAKDLFDGGDLSARMEGVVWNSNRAKDLVDEIPDAYKDIDAVMESQKDLVQVEHTLKQIFNYKG